MRHPRLSALVAAAAFTAFAAAAAPLVARTSDVQMVAVTVIPKDLPASGEWQFEVAMDTHVAPLEDDLAASATLLDGQGHTYAPLAWRGDGPGVHHRRGVLAFAPIAPRPVAVELRLQRRGEATPRSFKWTLPPQ